MISLKLNDQNSKEFEKLFNEHADKSIKHFEKELLIIRTGRAHPSIVEYLKVQCYGEVQTLKQVSAISTPDARTIIIQPWDKGLIADVERALQQSDLGLSSRNDGNVICVQLPIMSSARREELVKVLHKKTEEERIAIRNVRKEFHNSIRDAKKNSEISEDHARRLEETLQKLTDSSIKFVEGLANKKEHELKG